MRYESRSYYGSKVVQVKVFFDTDRQNKGRTDRQTGQKQDIKSDPHVSTNGEMTVMFLPKSWFPYTAQ